MSKKKQGVKKGSAQAKCYAARMQAEAEQQYAWYKWGGQVEMIDIFTVALIRMQKNHREAWFEKFNEVLVETQKEYRALIEQAQDDRIRKTDNVDLDELKVKMDRELAIGLGKNWAGWELRWNLARHTWGLTSFPPDYESSVNWTPEDEAELRKKAAWTLNVGARKQGDLPETEKQQYTAEQIQAINEMIAAQFKGEDA